MVGGDGGGGDGGGEGDDVLAHTQLVSSVFPLVDVNPTTATDPNTSLTLRETLQLVWKVPQYNASSVQSTDVTSLFFLT